MRPPGSSAELERRRHRAIRLIDRGLTPNEVALRLQVDPSSVRRWRQAWRRTGDRALDARPHPGPPRRLTPRQQAALLRRLRRGALASGFSTNRWTCARIAEVIEHHYGVRYHVDHIPRLLTSLGWSGRRPSRSRRGRS